MRKSRSRAKSDQSQSVNEIDARIRGLCYCLAGLIDISIPDRIPPDLDRTWEKRSDSGYGYQFVFWQHLIHIKYLISKLQEPLVDYPPAARLEVVRVRDLVEEIIDRYGASTLAEKALNLATPEWDAGKTPDWSNTPLPSTLILAKEEEFEGFLIALVTLGEALEDRPIAASPVENAKVPTRPSERAIQCYRILFLRGDSLTQQDVAEMVYGDRGKQSQVSRDLKRVEEYIKAHNILPDLSTEKRKVEIHPVDPRLLDQGGQPSGSYAKARKK